MRLESESTGNSTELKSLVLENVKLTRDLAGSIKKIRRYIFWMQFSGWIKFLLVAAPLVLAVIYLFPLAAKLQKTYSELLGSNQKGTNIQDLLNSPAIQELLKKK